MTLPKPLSGETPAGGNGGRTESLLHRAEEALRSGDAGMAVRALDGALEIDPGCVPAIKTLRLIEQRAGEAYRAAREERALQDLENAAGSDRLSGVIRRQAAFWNAPRVMEWIRSQAQAGGASSLSPPADPEHPEISIITPSHNRTEGLEKTVRSVLAQTVSGWEMLLVDDGSSDDTGREMRRLAGLDPHGRIRVLELPRNLGRAAARNRGVDESRGRFLLMLDSDDTIAPRFLERSRERLAASPAAAWIQPLTLQYGEVNRLYGYEPFSLEVQLSRNLFNITMLMRREVWEELGGMLETMREGLEDWEFWIRATLAGFRPEPLPEVLFFYHRSETGVSHSINTVRDHDLRCKLQIVLAHPEAYRALDRGAIDSLAQQREIPGSLVLTDRLAELEASAPRRFAVEPSHRPEDGTERAEGGEDRAAAPPCSPGAGKPGDQSHQTAVTAASPAGYPQASPRKVLFICHDFPPHRVAGAQLYALKLAKQLKSRGVEVEVIFPVVRGDLEPDYRIHTSIYEGIVVHKLAKDDNYEHEKVFNVRVEQVFDRFLGEHHFDLVHIHGFGQLSTAPLFSAKRHGLPVVMTLHDFWLICDRWHLVQPDGSICNGPESYHKCADCYLRTLGLPPDPAVLNTALDYKRKRREMFQRAFAQIDLALAPSEYFRDLFAEYGLTGVQYLPCGSEPMNPLPKEKHEPFVFGFFGQIIQRKGLDLLVKAFDHPALAGARLVIRGKTVDEEEYGKRVIAAAGRLPNVEFRGEYTPGELPRLYAGVDIAVVPSRMDNHPLTVLEAFLNRTPVIAADTGGIPEMVRHGVNGLLFRAGSVEDLREQLLRAFRDRGTVERLSAGIPAVPTIEEIAGVTLGLYRDLLGGRRPVVPGFAHLAAGAEGEISTGATVDDKAVPESRMGIDSPLPPENIELAWQPLGDVTEGEPEDAAVEAGGRG